MKKARLMLVLCNTQKDMHQRVGVTLRGCYDYSELCLAHAATTLTKTYELYRELVVLLHM